MPKRSTKKLRNLKPRTPDAAVLQKMRLMGVDLAQERTTNYYSYFPTWKQANLAKVELGGHGFSVEICKSPNGRQWLCPATKVMVPGLEELSTLTSMMKALAARIGGEFDGWETEITDAEARSGRWFA